MCLSLDSWITLFRRLLVEFISRCFDFGTPFRMMSHIIWEVQRYEIEHIEQTLQMIRELLWNTQFYQMFVSHFTSSPENIKLVCRKDLPGLCFLTFFPRRVGFFQNCSRSSPGDPFLFTREKKYRLLAVLNNRIHDPCMVYLPIFGWF